MLQRYRTRFSGPLLNRSGLHASARLAFRHIRRFCLVYEAGQQLPEKVTDRLGLSARTVADLAEAIQHRRLDRRVNRPRVIENVAQKIA